MIGSSRLPSLPMVLRSSLDRMTRRSKCGTQVSRSTDNLNFLPFSSFFDHFSFHRQSNT